MLAVNVKTLSDAQCASEVLAIVNEMQVSAVLNLVIAGNLHMLLYR